MMKIYKILCIACSLFFLLSVFPTQIGGQQYMLQAGDYTTQFTINFDIEDLQYEKIDTYDVVSLREGTFINDIGKPLLPAQEIKIAIAPDVTIDTVTVTEIESLPLDGTYTIYPSQPYLPTNQDESTIKGINSSFIFSWTRTLSNALQTAG